MDGQVGSGDDPALTLEGREGGREIGWHGLIWLRNYSGGELCRCHGTLTADAVSALSPAMDNLASARLICIHLSLDVEATKGTQTF